MVRRERDQLRRRLTTIGHLSRHGRKQGVETPISSRSCESHLHPQKPSGHPARWCPLPSGCHLQSRGSGLRSFEPLPRASPLHLRALQSKSAALQCQRGMGVDQAKGSASRPRWPGAVEGSLSTAREQELLRNAAGQHGRSRLVATEEAPGARGRGTLALPEMWSGGTRYQRGQEAAPAEVPRQTHA